MESPSTAYGTEQTAASDIWEKINRGELHPSKRKTRGKTLEQAADTSWEILPDPEGFNEDVTDNADLDSSAKGWSTAKHSATLVAKQSVTRSSLDSLVTVADANNALIDRPLSHIKRKLSLESEFVKPAVQGVDRAAEAQRKMEEAKKQRAERQKQEEEERIGAEARRQAREQEKCEVEEQRRVQEELERHRIGEERARALVMMTGADGLSGAEHSGDEVSEADSSGDGISEEEESEEVMEEE